MKGKVIASLLLVTFLTGCSSNTKDLENEVNLLKEKVTKLEQAMLTNETTKENVTEQGNTANVDDIKNKISSFQTSSDALVKKMNEATDAKNRNDNINTYVQLEKEADLWEREIDTYEDQLERSYNVKELSFEDYRGFEKQLDDLSELVDQAEDSLSLRLQVDD